MHYHSISQLTYPPCVLLARGRNVGQPKLVSTFKQMCQLNPLCLCSSSHGQLLDQRASASVMSGFTGSGLVSIRTYVEKKTGFDLSCAVVCLPCIPDNPHNGSDVDDTAFPLLCHYLGSSLLAKRELP